MALVFRKDGRLLGKCLNCEQFAVSKALDLINGGKSSLPQLSEGLEYFVKTHLVEHFSQIFQPDREDTLINDVELDRQRVLLQKSEADGFGMYGILVGMGVPIPLENDLKLELEVDRGAIEIIVPLGLFLSEGYVAVGEQHMYLLVFVMIDPEGGVQRKDVFLDAGNDV